MSNFNTGLAKPMSYPVRLIHLTLKVPKGSSRARSLCGYSLRQGARFAELKNHLYEGRLDNAIIKPPNCMVWLRERNRNCTRGVPRKEYREHLCPECLEHPDYVLTLLADLP
jgi:hypothetical protein